MDFWAGRFLSRFTGVHLVPYIFLKNWTSGCHLKPVTIKPISRIFRVVVSVIEISKWRTSFFGGALFA